VGELVSLDAKRLATALSSAGLNDRQVMAEVLMMLPEGFVSAYEQVYLAAYGSGAVRVSDNPRQGVKKNDVRIRSNQADRVGGVGVGKKSSASRGSVVHSGHALTVKTFADRKLRALARDIRARMGDDSGSLPRRCAGRCKRWADTEWNYCPNCGGPTETVDERGE
jgi:acyl-CoA synthetase (AMP-forming)/AMP-acid ligase II